MEVRAAYVAEDFEWDQLQRLTVEDIQAANVKLLRKHATATVLGGDQGKQ